MDKQYTCLLCQQPGERLVASVYLPNLFVLQEHLVKDHGVPWEYVLLSSTLPGGVGQDGEVIEWCLPPEKAAACDLPQGRYLRVVPRAHAQAAPFYIVATFPSRESCLQAEMEIIDQCKRSHPTSLAGGAGELEGGPIVVFVDLRPGHEPDRSLQQRIWSAIHLYQGVCVAIPAEIVEAVADTLRDEISAGRQAHPEANWAEIDYLSGTTFYDVPTRSEVARDTNEL